MNNLNTKKINQNALVSILVHGCNQLSFDLATLLMNQGGRVVIVDEYNSKSKKFITQLKEIGQADLVDFKGLDDTLANLNRIDYIFYFLHEYLHTASQFSSKEFLEETNRINSTLKATKKFESKLALITTIKLNQDLSAHVLNTNLSAPLPYSPIELQKYAETLTAEGRDRYKINARIIRLGALLGKQIQNIFDTTLYDLTNSASKGDNLDIYGEGLDVHYLIHQNDATYGILKLTFSDKTQGEVISLANNHDYTTLSIAYKLLELNPEIQQIKFHTINEKASIIFDQYIPAPNATDYGWSQKVNLEQALAETIAVFHPEKSEKILATPLKERTLEETEEIVKKSTTKKTFMGSFISLFTTPFVKLFSKLKNFLSIEKAKLSPTRAVYISVILAISALFLYYILIPITGIVLSSILLYTNTKSAFNNVTALKFDLASENLNLSSKYISKNETYLSRLKWIFSITNKNELFDSSSQLLFASDYAVSGAKTLTQALEPLAKYAKEFQPSLDFTNSLPSSTREYRTYLKELQSNSKGLDRAAYNLKIASQILSNTDLSIFPKILQKPLSEVKMTNENIIKQIEPSQKIISFIPELLGVDARKRYLILLQNPGELRSTGGWLSSYGIVAIEGGQIRELKVDDIYNAEGQLKIANKLFNAPQDMQKALDIKNWSVSLSNWNPSFPDTSKNATYFFTQLDAGTTFDGVIAIDTEVISNLLEVWGGIKVPGEDVQITSQNLNEKIFQLHNEFIPGQSVKSTFLANLANETLKKIFTSNVTDLSAISQSIMKSLSEKHILVYMKDKDASTFFEDMNWSGTIDSRYQNAPVPIEWNWGGNKANLFIERSHSLIMNVISESEVNYEYSTYIQNKSISKIYPQGDYINYMRIYLPLNAKISSAIGFLDNNYSTYRENGFLVVGGWMNVPTKSTKSLNIKYSVSKTETTINFPIQKDQSNISTDLFIFKQPGTKNDIYDISVIYPNSWSIQNAEGLTQTVNTLSSRFNLEIDKAFVIIWKVKN